MHVCLFEPPNFLHALHQFLYFDLFPHKKKQWVLYEYMFHSNIFVVYTIKKTESYM